MLEESKHTLVLGAPATGPKFWPRPDVVHLLEEALVNDHVLFPGPRRTGKTSILLHLRDGARAPRRVVFINAEKFVTAPELIHGIAEAVLTPDLQKRVAGWIRTGASKIKGVKFAMFGVDFHEATKTDWAKAADALIRSLLDASEPVLIMIDEFSVFVNALAKKNPEEAERLLHWFREWRQQLVNTPIRFLLTGSIGIDTVLRKLGLGTTVNDCRTIDMFPPNSDDARDFLRQRATENGIELPAEVACRMLELIDPHWHYPLQIFLVEVQNGSRRKGHVPDLSELDAIYRDAVVAKGNENLKHMWDKLSEIFGHGERRFARDLLKEMIRAPQGMSRDAMESIHARCFPPGAEDESVDFEYVLGVLRHDGYLIQDPGAGHRTRFASNLLRDYWTRQHA